MVAVRTVKYFADGVIESGTEALIAPYTDAPHSCGLPNWDYGERSEAVAAFDALGFQTHIHAIGDLCHLDGDITDLPPTEIADVRVSGTWRRGEAVHRT